MDGALRLTLLAAVVSLPGCSLVGAAGGPRADVAPPDVARPTEDERAPAVRVSFPAVGRDTVERPALPARPPVEAILPEPPSRYGNPESYVVFGQRYTVLDSSEGYEGTGLASWYGEESHGRRTSSGETYDMHAPTAAHRSLPLPSYVEVTNLANGRSVVLRVNDRGPFKDTHERIIDVSYAAAVALDMVEQGTVPVRVRAVGPVQVRR